MRNIVEQAHTALDITPISILTMIAAVAQELINDVTIGSMDFHTIKIHLFGQGLLTRIQCPLLGLFLRPARLNERSVARLHERMITPLGVKTVPAPRLRLKKRHSARNQTDLPS